MEAQLWRRGFGGGETNCTRAQTPIGLARCGRGVRAVGGFLLKAKNLQELFALY